MAALIQNLKPKSQGETRDPRRRRRGRDRGRNHRGRRDRRRERGALQTLGPAETSAAVASAIADDMDVDQHDFNEPGQVFDGQPNSVARGSGNQSVGGDDDGQEEQEEDDFDDCIDAGTYDDDDDDEAEDFSDEGDEDDDMEQGIWDVI